MSELAINLLFRVMEARPASVQGTTLHHVSPRAAEMLLEAKFLIASGHVPVIAGMDDYEDEPIEATWSPELKSFGYHDSVGRWVQVDEQEIAAYRVDYGLALAKMLVAFERAGPPRPASLVDGIVWDVGTIRLSGAKAPVPVWFARRLGDPAAWQKVEGLIKRRPPDEVRIILTSTQGDRIPATSQRRNHIISVADVAKSPRTLAISPQILGARVFPGHVQRRFPIDHSDDFGFVYLRNETLKFRSDKQRHLLRLLFEAYKAGSPVCRTDTVLFEAGYKDSTNSFSKVFSGREDWRRFIKYDDGNCWIEP